VLSSWWLNEFKKQTCARHIGTTLWFLRVKTLHIHQTYERTRNGFKALQRFHCPTLMECFPIFTLKLTASITQKVMKGPTSIFIIYLQTYHLLLPLGSTPKKHHPKNDKKKPREKRQVWTRNSVKSNSPNFIMVSVRCLAFNSICW